MLPITSQPTAAMFEAAFRPLVAARRRRSSASSSRRSSPGRSTPPAPAPQRFPDARIGSTTRIGRGRPRDDGAARATNSRAGRVARRDRRGSSIAARRQRLYACLPDLSHLQRPAASAERKPLIGSLMKIVPVLAQRRAGRRRGAGANVRARAGNDARPGSQRRRIRRRPALSVIHTNAPELAETRRPQAARAARRRGTGSVRDPGSRSGDRDPRRSGCGRRLPCGLSGVRANRMLGVYVHCRFVRTSVRIAISPSGRSEPAARERYCDALDAEIARRRAARRRRCSSAAARRTRTRADDSPDCSSGCASVSARRRTCGDFDRSQSRPLLDGSSHVSRGRDSTASRSACNRSSRTNCARSAAAQRRRTSRTVSARARRGLRLDVDLMFGVPGQTRGIVGAFARRGDRARASSSLDLWVDDRRGTPYARWQAREPGVRRRGARSADVRTAIDKLTRGRLRALRDQQLRPPGLRCEHNANYWANGAYLGFRRGCRVVSGRRPLPRTPATWTYMGAALGGEPIPSEMRATGRRASRGRGGHAGIATARGRAGSVPRTVRRRCPHALRPGRRGIRAAGLLVADERLRAPDRRGRFVANDVCGAFVTFD